MTELFEIPFAQRGENVAQVIRDAAPDILCLSERHDEWAGIVNANAMDGAVNLSELLEGSCSAVADNCMESGNYVVANRVPIFYNPAVFRCVDSGILKLTEEYPFERSENKRTVSWAILEDVTDSITRGTKIAVFNSHWSIKEYNGTSYAEIRATQSREMQALINDPQFADLPRVVCGDFNALYNEEILQELLNNCGLTHADVAVNGRVTWNSVDHIGVTGAWITSYTVRRDIRLASDHPPIYVDLIV